MLKYPYSYGDDLSEEVAMQRRVDLFDKGLVLVALWGVWSLIPNNAFASDSTLAKLPEAPNAAPSPNPGTFAPIVGICKCTSPQVKTAILLFGLSSVCYSAFCSKDEKLIFACTAVTTYVVSQLVK